MILIGIAIGGALGSVLRYLIGGAIQRSSASGFPYGTLTVNVLGCFIIGILVELFLNLEPPGELRAFLIVGFCGGFTTFSTFSNETVGLFESGSYVRAAVYASATFALCLSATLGAMALVRALASGVPSP